MEQEPEKKPEPDEIVKMEITGITQDPSNNMPILILKSEKDDTAIPIWIGLIEASAIAVELEGLQLPRPMTHDLLKSMLEKLGGKLQRIEVCDLKENTYYATLIIKTADSEVQIDARPSDAIALALRTGADIYVAAKVLKMSQQVDISALQDAIKDNSDPEAAKKEKDKWSEILENLNPEDFGKYKM